MKHSEAALPDPAPDLLAGARRGEDAAVRALIKANNQRLFRVARAVLRNDGEAEDVVQETYVRAFTRLDTFRGDSSFSTWLTRIALNEALGRRRRQRPTTDIEMIDETPPSAEVIAFPKSPEAEAARGEVKLLLEACIDALPADLRTIFVLRDVEELSTEEAADFLDIKPETAKTRLHRARRALRSALAERLSPSFAELYPFDGARCVRLADKVIERLKRVEEEKGGR